MKAILFLWVQFNRVFKFHEYCKSFINCLSLLIYYLWLYKISRINRSEIKCNAATVILLSFSIENHLVWQIIMINNIICLLNMSVLFLSYKSSWDPYMDWWWDEYRVVVCSVVCSVSLSSLHKFAVYSLTSVPWDLYSTDMYIGVVLGLIKTWL